MLKRILAAAAFSLVASVACAQVQSEMAELRKLNAVIGLPTNAKSTATDGTSVTLTSILKQVSASVQAMATAFTTLNAKDFATQTTLAAVLAKIITAPATEAKQDTGNTSLGTIVTNTGTAATNTGTIATNTGTIVTNTGTAAINTGTIATNTGAATTALQLIDNAIGSKAGGTAAADSFLMGGVFNTTLPTLTDGQQVALQMTTRGSVIGQLYNGAVAITGSADNADAVAETASANALKVVTRPYLYNGTTWDRARGNTFGAFGVIRDAGGNARGANVNASNQLEVAATVGSLPLPTGASTAAKQPALGTAGTPSADVVTIQGAASGTAVPVSVSAVIPGTGATNLGKAVDSAAGATDTGVVLLGVRDDALSTLTPIEGDYVPVRVNSTGAVHTTGSTTYTEAQTGITAPVGPTVTWRDASDVMHGASEEFPLPVSSPDLASINAKAPALTLGGAAPVAAVDPLGNQFNYDAPAAWDIINITMSGSSQEVIPVRTPGSNTRHGLELQLVGTGTAYCRWGPTAAAVALGSHNFQLNPGMPAWTVPFMMNGPPQTELNCIGSTGIAASLIGTEYHQ